MSNYDYLYEAKPGTPANGVIHPRYGCGCHTKGNGITVPIEIVFCNIHRSAHQTRDVLRNLLNACPVKINETEIGKKARLAAVDQLVNLTPGPSGI